MFLMPAIRDQQALLEAVSDWYARRYGDSFQGVCPTTQETRTFFVEYSILNPALGTTQPILGQHPYYKRHGMKPSYVCIKAGVFPKNGDGGLQLQSYYPMTSLQVAQDPFYMHVIPENYL